MHILKPIFKFIKFFIPEKVLRNYYFNVGQEKSINKWIQSGKPVPPPDAFKQMTVAKYQKQYRVKTLVETGTFLGSMINAQKDNFKDIHTIELSEEYYRNAVKLFEKQSHIHLYQGDSADILNTITAKLKKRAIFWLDAHYSIDIFAKGKSDCPVFEELDAIFSNNLYKHIILIDDARDFIGVGDYPTRQQVIDHVKLKDSSYSVVVDTDIFRFTPSS